MTPARAGIAAAALAVAALGACTSSGGTTTPTSSAPPVTSSTPAPSTPAPTSEPVTSSGPVTSSTAPATRSLTAIKPVLPSRISCAALPRALGRFLPGGSLPSGVPVPQAVPSVTCTGAHHAIAVAWRNVTVAQYAQELVGTGWTRSGTTYRNTRASRTITVTEVSGNLVAVYRPAR